MSSTPAHPPLLVAAPEAARMLSISPRSLWTLTSRGQIPAVRLGRSVRYSVADLRDWIERARTTEATR